MSGVFERLGETRLVPVLVAEDAGAAEEACRALVAGGLPVVEITFRTEAAADSIRRASEIDGLLVGAGTVLSPEQLLVALDAGARFVVAPGTSEAVAAAMERVDVPYIPGAATPTEIEHARALGCKAVKIFPASMLGGPAFVKAVAAVYRDVQFVPTGGIGPDNLGAFLELPSVLACGGSWMCEPSLIRDGRFDEIERRARKAVELAGAVAT